MTVCPNCRLEFDRLGVDGTEYCCGTCRSKGGERGVSQIGSCIHCSMAVGRSEKPALFDAVFRALLLLDLGEDRDRAAVLNLRQVCSSFRSMVKHFATSELGRDGVVLSDVLFMSAFADEFTDFSKANSRRVVDAGRSFSDGYMLYLNVRMNIAKRPNQPCYIELFPEKKILFPKRIGSRRRKRDNPAWTNGQLFNPNGAWTPEINDSWALGNIHAGSDFRLLANINHLVNFWDGEYDRPTALGRELIQVWRAGYTPVTHDTCSDHFKGYGVLFKAPDREPAARVADLADAKYTSFDQMRACLDWVAAGLGVGSTAAIKMPTGTKGKRDGPRLDPDTGEPM